ncbi:MAG: hypothetical protein H7A24_04250 [Leptospiraceae bacterium]|nr:hypothetical protein [Leptospiraceae bacterium]MCP5511066.1 hypothetical protein [Leptospiraceae bacterium]
MEDSLIVTKKSPKGYSIKVNIEKNLFEIYLPDGSKENLPENSVNKVLFLGSNFNLKHFYLGEVVYLNAQDKKLHIPYSTTGGFDKKILSIPCPSSSDLFPVILYHYHDSKDAVKASSMGFHFKHIIVDENLPKNEMVTIKVRFPNVNILIQKKKTGV